MATDPRSLAEDENVVLERFVDAIEALLRDGQASIPVSRASATCEEAGALSARALQAQRRSAALCERVARSTGPDPSSRHRRTASVHRAVGLLMLTFGVDAVRATTCLTRLARRHRVAPDELAVRLLDAWRPTLDVGPGEPDGACDGDASDGVASATDPMILRRALTYIHGHVGEPIGVGEIAAAVAISTRELQRLFRRHRDTTPLAYLRRVRLEGAHLELRAADPHRGDTVASIAFRWGFGHPGRFSMAYQDCYEQPPSHTLRTAQPAAPARVPRPGP